MPYSAKTLRKRRDHGARLRADKSTLLIRMGVFLVFEKWTDHPWTLFKWIPALAPARVATFNKIYRGQQQWLLSFL